MNGILIVNKSEGFTSRDVVNKLSKIFNTKKIGHTGTLDPIAKGVLVVVIGKYTKLCEDLTQTFKEYIATFKLGILTDTLDITGEILDEKDVTVSEEEIRNVIASYKCVYDQEVPIYSSVKINGRKLYEYARNGEYVVLPKRKVDIKNIEVIDINKDIVKIKCLVSKGTYIRSLIRDIGSSLNTFATMTDLIRIKQGIFDIRDSYTLEDIENGNYKLIDIEDVMDIYVIENDTYLKDVTNGVKLKLDIENKYILFKHEGNNIALYKKDNDYFRMYIHF
ncbi:tRNA pseudouridine synthase B [Firmicutes bacterium CAG:582]|nr:tRNA pseudouridine synthase B [Firmicutes bacterium CAG:582]